MLIITKEIIETGLKLEANRRSEPLTENGHSVKYEEHNKEYVDFLIRYGWLLLNQLKNSS